MSYSEFDGAENASDAFKDAYGYRPSAEMLASIVSDPVALDRLYADVQTAIIDEERDWANGAKRLFETISNIAANANVGYATALAWDVDAHAVNGDFGYYLWHYNTNERHYNALMGDK